MCELAVSTLPSGFPVKVRAWFSHISTGFEKIEWSANNDHEWNAKNDHRWVIFLPSVPPAVGVLALPAERSSFPCRLRPLSLSDLLQEHVSTNSKFVDFVQTFFY